jgi:hypothetical protein
MKLSVLLPLLVVVTLMALSNYMVSGSNLKQKLLNTLEEDDDRRRKPTKYPTKATPWPTGATSVGDLNWFASAFAHIPQPLPSIGQCPRKGGKYERMGTFLFQPATLDCRWWVNPIGGDPEITSIDGFPTIQSFYNHCNINGTMLLFKDSVTCDKTLETPLEVTSFCVSTAFGNAVYCCGDNCVNDWATLAPTTIV